MSKKILPLQGTIQPYAWGGTKYIPELLGINNESQQPCAELWIGAHPKGPSKVRIDRNWQLLNEVIQMEPEEFLGAEVAGNFDNRLPFLFKVLDVKNMLSIQAHPNKKQAEAGFERENFLEIPISAGHRVYRDDNHKPEIMVALTDFWLLHGFQSAEAIYHLIQNTEEFKVLAPYFENKDVKALYKIIMEAEQERIDELLRPLHDRLTETEIDDKNHPDFWAAKAFTENVLEGGHFDRGIFSIYFFNLVYLKEGQGIFQDAGIPHAYLEGVNIELMANSDNVFRGGLTVKHIDVPELLDKLIFDAVKPAILEGEELDGSIISYPSPAPDFALHQLKLKLGKKINFKSNSPEAFIVISGNVKLSNDYTRMRLSKGDTFYICPGASYELEGILDAVIFKASVPNGG